MQWQSAYQTYNHNLFRQLKQVHRHLHCHLHDELVAAGYSRVKMDAIFVIPFIGPQGTRLADLVAMHHMPKATMARLINGLHHQGLLEKRVDPEDSRANRLMLTGKAIKLIELASRLAFEAVDALAELMGEEAFAQFMRAITACQATLRLQEPAARQFVEALHQDYGKGLLIMHLEALIRFIGDGLYAQLQHAGFDDLQNSQLTVLNHISEHGTRASAIARRERLSKQSISDITHTLVSAGYIKTVTDPEDRRARLLIFTERGRQLIICSVRRLLKIEDQMRETMGVDQFDVLEQLSGRLWFVLQGVNPSPTADDQFAALDPLIDSWVENLKSELTGRAGSFSAQVFQQKPDGYCLQRGFTDYLNQRIFTAQRQGSVPK